MCNQGVSFHLSETDTSSSFSSLKIGNGQTKQSVYNSQIQRLDSASTHLDGLSSERVDRTRCSDLELVVHHVSKTLVVDAS